MKISPAVLTVSLADYLQFFTQCALSAMINTLVTIIQKKKGDIGQCEKNYAKKYNRVNIIEVTIAVDFMKLFV